MSFADEMAEQSPDTCPCERGTIVVRLSPRHRAALRVLLTNTFENSMDLSTAEAARRLLDAMERG